MRRLALTALVLDAFVGALVLGGSFGEAPAPVLPAPRYVEVAGTCLEMTDVDAYRTSGREVAAALCAGR